MARSHHRDADKYLERQRTMRIVGIVAVALVGLVTASLVVFALMNGPS